MIFRVGDRVRWDVRDHPGRGTVVGVHEANARTFGVVWDSDPTDPLWAHEHELLLIDVVDQLADLVRT